MHEDDIYVIIVALLLVILLAVLQKNNKKFALANFVVFALYTAICMYKYICVGEGGGAFVAWAAMLFFSCLQILMVVSYIIVLRIKNKKI